MGHAIDALPMGLKNVQRNPVLIAISFLALLLAIPVLIIGGIIAAILSLVPLFGQAAARLILAVPLKILLLGGIAGAAGKGFSGDVSLKDYLSVVRNNFASLAGGFAIYEGIIFAITLVFSAVLVFMVFGGSMAMSSMSEPSTMMSGFGVGLIVIYALALLVVFLVAVVFQFIDVAVVLGDYSATGAVSESARLAKEAPLSVLGYTILRGVLGTVILLPGLVIAAAGGQFVDVLQPVGLLVTLLLYPVALAVVMSYHAAYYGVRVRTA